MYHVKAWPLERLKANWHNSEVVTSPASCSKRTGFNKEKRNKFVGTWTRKTIIPFIRDNGGDNTFLGGDIVVGVDILGETIKSKLPSKSKTR